MRVAACLPSAGVMLVLAPFASLPALAQISSEGAYAGGSVGSARATDLSGSNFNMALEGQGLSVRTVSVNDSDTGWKLFVGYRFNRNFAVEGGYTWLGKYGFQGQVTTDPGTVEASFKAYDLNGSLLGIVPVTEQAELFAKAGLGYWRANLSASGTFSGDIAHSAESSGTSPIVGLGARYEFNPAWSLRAEWERFFKVGNDTVTGQTDVDFWSVGIQYRF